MRVELRRRVEERRAAPRAPVDAVVGAPDVLPRPGCLRAAFPEHPVLLGREPLPPLSFGLLGHGVIIPQTRPRASPARACPGRRRPPKDQLPASARRREKPAPGLPAPGGPGARRSAPSAPPGAPDPRRPARQRPEGSNRAATVTRP